MANLDRMAYLVRRRLPRAYAQLEAAGRLLTRVLYRPGIRRALAAAPVSGTVQGQPAAMRPLTTADHEALAAMIRQLPAQHLEFFRPHGFDAASLRQMLAAPTILTYGLFVASDLGAYALLKLQPNRKAYIGRLVVPALAGAGCGRFLARYLYWQANLAGFQPCSTISRRNLASLRSHAAVRPYRVLAELPDDYLLVAFTLNAQDEQPPPLCIAPAGSVGQQAGRAVAPPGDGSV